MQLRPVSRRAFLVTTAGLLTARAALGDDRPTVDNPRATDGDLRHEPDWDQRLVVTVGPRKADIVGASDRALQAAVDYVARLGGGTVKILPGTFTLRNAIHLPSRIRLQGSGSETILTKIPSETIQLAADSDWYDQEITLEKAAGFRVGDGVLLQTKNPHNGATDVIKRTLIACSGRRFKLNDGIRKNLWLSGSPTCSSLFPLLTSEHTSDVTIEDLVLDGNRANNVNLNGNYGGGIFLQDCNRFTFRNVESRNYNGDGFSFQICHDVLVENCYSHDNADLGVHPGSGSQRPIIRNSRMENNTIGLFWCWGVKYGMAVDNQMTGNRNYGISIGHNDTDNVMRRNVVRDSGRVGILFRDDSRGQDFWANRNTLEDNTVINSGGEDGVAIDIQGRTRDLQIQRNKLIERRAPMQRTGVRISANASSIQLAQNTIEGFSVDVRDLRS